MSSVYIFDMFASSLLCPEGRGCFVGLSLYKAPGSAGIAGGIAGGKPVNWFMGRCGGLP